MLPFALNCMVAPGLRWELLMKPGCVGPEHRSDLPGTSFGLSDPAMTGATVRARQLRFLARIVCKAFAPRSDAQRAWAVADGFLRATEARTDALNA